MLTFSIIKDVEENCLYNSEIKNFDSLMMDFCINEWPKLYSFYNNIVYPASVTLSKHWKYSYQLWKET
jgi:hypothetical protein